MKERTQIIICMSIVAICISISMFLPHAEEFFNSNKDISDYMFYIFVILVILNVIMEICCKIDNNEIENDNSEIDKKRVD